MNMQIIKAAQARAASAVSMSNPLLWDEAKAMYQAGVQWQDSMALAGMSHHYRKITVGDAQINFEVYGDFIICDADNQKANLAINLDLPDGAYKQ